MTEHKISRISGIEVAALVGLVILMALPLTCNRRLEITDKTVIRLWIHGEPEARVLMAEAAENFNNIQDEIYVQVEDQSGGKGRWIQKYMSSMQSGSCADVVFTHWKLITEFGSKDQLVALDDYAARDNFDLNAFFPGAVDAYRFQGNLYAMPVYGSTMVMFYNKDLFDEAGVDYPTEEWTWSDFLDAAKKLTKRDEKGRVVQVGCLPYDPSSWIWSAGGSFGNEDCTEFGLTDPKTLEALQFYVDLKNKHKVTTEGMSAAGADPTSVDVFEKGRIAMDINGPWKLPKYMEKIKDTFDWDASLFPLGPNGRHTRYAGMGFAIWSGSREQEASWELVKYLCGPEAGKILAQSEADIPARIEAAQLAISKEQSDCPVNKQVFLDAMTKGQVHIYPAAVNFSELKRAFDDAMDFALYGSKTLEESMSDAENRTRKWNDSPIPDADSFDYISMAIVLALGLGIATWRFTRSNSNGSSMPTGKPKGA